MTLLRKSDFPAIAAGRKPGRVTLDQKAPLLPFNGMKPWEVPCAFCGKACRKSERHMKRFCSDACKMRDYRERKYNERQKRYLSDLKSNGTWPSCTPAMSNGSSPSGKKKGGAK